MAVLNVWSLWMALTVVQSIHSTFYDLDQATSTEILSDYVQERKHSHTLPKTRPTALAQVSDNRFISNHRTIFSDLGGSRHKLSEWISDGNVLLALIIGIIVVFLIVCVLCFYFAFFPDGIP